MKLHQSSRFRSALLASLTWATAVSCSSSETSKAPSEEAGGQGGEGAVSSSGNASGGSVSGSSTSGGTETAGSPAGQAGDGSIDGSRGGNGATGGDANAGMAAVAGADTLGSGEAGAGGAAPCTPGASCGADGVLRVCSETGALATLHCTNGCEAGACLPTNLSTGWLLHQFHLSDDAQQAEASYSFSQNGLSALQSANSLPSVYYLDQELRNVVVKGQFAVETTSDDDMIGFVFGYQDSEHFYLFDWKQATQADSTCGTAEVGAALKLVNGSAELTKCQDFWSSSGSPNVSVLVAPSVNPVGWLDNTVYDFQLSYRPGKIAIEVKQGDTVVVSLQSSDATYPAGRFGFYNYSQEQSRYQFFDIQPQP